MSDDHAADVGFDAVVERALSRRRLLGRGLALGAALLGGSALTPAAAGARDRFGFAPVGANTLDTVTVPAGYRWHVVVAWGDPLWSGAPAFDQATAGTGASQERAFGDYNDGMALFSADGRHLLAVNHEYTNLAALYRARADGKPANADDVRKGKAAVGVSVVELAEADGGWRVVLDSPYNRRITADTPMRITGPAAGHDWLKTAADPTGSRVLGTWSNCGSGRTPWGTYLTCEENFDRVFSPGAAGFEPTAAQRRYGIGDRDWGYAWATADERFDLSRHPNEANRIGYVVEIDPRDPASTPAKRTALGRFKHENAALTLARDGRVVVYMGDDERGEFLYRFVSDGRYVAGADNADLLDSGRLYVAGFDDDMRGRWIELTPAATGMAHQAEICIHTRQAASAAGATTMDRPEWVAVNPGKVEAYCSLTNNIYRGIRPNAGGDATPVAGPNPRRANRYGQIVRWVPDGDDHAATGFAWDLFVLAGNPAVHGDANAGSANLSVANMFNSPDGLAFDAAGRLWIRTDGNVSDAGDFAGQGNNQMLVGDPETGEIRRFLVGPRGCEVTGTAWSPDRRTLFVGIQHPGEKADSHWPDGGDALPRSAVIAIQRDDGGAVG